MKWTLWNVEKLRYVALLRNLDFWDRTLFISLMLTQVYSQNFQTANFNALKNCLEFSRSFTAPGLTGFWRSRSKSLVSFCNCVRLKNFWLDCLPVYRWCFLVDAGVVFLHRFQQVMGLERSHCVAKVVFVLNWSEFRAVLPGLFVNLSKQRWRLNWSPWLLMCPWTGRIIQRGRFSAECHWWKKRYGTLLMVLKLLLVRRMTGTRSSSHEKIERWR